LPVGATTADIDLGLVSDELRLEHGEGTDDAFESGGDIREVGDTTTNDENLAIGARRWASEEINYSAFSFYDLQMRRHVRIVLAYSKVCPSVGAPEYSP
jgi:hypothetical protein